MFFTQGCFFLVTDPEVWMLGMALGSIGLQPAHTCCICYFFFYMTSPTQGKSSVSTSSASLGRIMNCCPSGCTEILKLDSLAALLGIVIVAPQIVVNVGTVIKGLTPWCRRPLFKVEEEVRRLRHIATQEPQQTARPKHG